MTARALDVQFEARSLVKKAHESMRMEYSLLTPALGLFFRDRSQRCTIGRSIRVLSFHLRPKIILSDPIFTAFTLANDRSSFRLVIPSSSLILRHDRALSHQYSSYGRTTSLLPMGGSLTFLEAPASDQLPPCPVWKSCLILQLLLAIPRI